MYLLPSPSRTILLCLRRLVLAIPRGLLLLPTMRDVGRSDRIPDSLCDTANDGIVRAGRLATRRQSPSSSLAHAATEEVQASVPWRAQRSCCRLGDVSGVGDRVDNEESCPERCVAWGVQDRRDVRTARSEVAGCRRDAAAFGWRAGLHFKTPSRTCDIFVNATLFPRFVVLEVKSLTSGFKI